MELELKVREIIGYAAGSEICYKNSKFDGNKKETTKITYVTYGHLKTKLMKIIVLANYGDNIEFCNFLMID